jgi:uncharacterized membrane protein HdeD (DUF308 family)
MNENDRKRSESVILQIIIPAVTATIGAVLLFVPQIGIETLCYVFCGGLIVAGISSLVRFFLSESYKRLYGNHFAVGIMLLLLGICSLLRTATLAEHFEYILGLISLMLGTVVLQNTVQLRMVNSGLWYLEALFSAVTLIGIIPVLAEIRPVLGLVDNYPYWIFFLTGVLSLISLLVTYIGLRVYRKKQEQEQQSPAAFMHRPDAVDVTPQALPESPAADPIDEEE